jgi:cytochrome c biogenesis protein CcmG/thiol:disulfide interchange protein DsbE
MTTLTIKTILGALVLVLLLSGLSSAALKAKDPAPTFSLRDSRGTEIRLDDLVGAPEKGGNGVILSFFASWCIPCRNELPILNGLVDELKMKGIAVVLIGVKEDYRSIRALMENLHVDKPIILSDLNGTVSEQYQIRFLPVTFFIGRDGKIKQVVYGEIESAQSARDKAAALVQ